MYWQPVASYPTVSSTGFYSELVEHFYKSRYGMVMLTDSIRNTFLGLKSYMTKNNTSFATLLCLIPENV